MRIQIKGCADYDEQSQKVANESRSRKGLILSKSVNNIDGKKESELR